jgi:hypothetical protein
MNANQVFYKGINKYKYLDRYLYIYIIYIYKKYIYFIYIYIPTANISVVGPVCKKLSLIPKQFKGRKGNVLAWTEGDSRDGLVSRTQSWASLWLGLILFYGNRWLPLGWKEEPHGQRPFSE